MSSSKCDFSCFWIFSWLSANFLSWAYGCLWNVGACYLVWLLCASSQTRPQFFLGFILGVLFVGIMLIRCVGCVLWHLPLLFLLAMCFSGLLLLPIFWPIGPALIRLVGISYILKIFVLTYLALSIWMRMLACCSLPQRRALMAFIFLLIILFFCIYIYFRRFWFMSFSCIYFIIHLYYRQGST